MTHNYLIKKAPVGNLYYLDHKLLDQIGYTNRIPGNLTKYKKPHQIRYLLKYRAPKFKHYIKYLQRAVDKGYSFYIVPTRTFHTMALYILRDKGLEYFKDTISVLGLQYDYNNLAMTDTHYIYRIPTKLYIEGDL